MNRLERWVAHDCYSASASLKGATLVPNEGLLGCRVRVLIDHEQCAVLSRPLVQRCIRLGEAV